MDFDDLVVDDRLLIDELGLTREEVRRGAASLAAPPPGAERGLSRTAAVAAS